MFPVQGQIVKILDSGDPEATYSHVAWKQPQTTCKQMSVATFTAEVADPWSQSRGSTTFALSALWEPVGYKELFSGASRNFCEKHHICSVAGVKTKLEGKQTWNQNES